jgi:hypothetical protein
VTKNTKIHKTFDHIHIFQIYTGYDGYASIKWNIMETMTKNTKNTKKHKNIREYARIFHIFQIYTGYAIYKMKNYVTHDKKYETHKTFQNISHRPLYIYTAYASATSVIYGSFFWGILKLLDAFCKMEFKL